MKNKILLSILIFVMTLSCLSVNIYAEIPLRVVVNMEKISFPDAEPFIDNNSRVQVPVRFVAEALNAAVDWDPVKEEVTIKRDNNIIILKIGNKDITVNGKTISLDTAPILKDDRTFVPVRFVSEALGAKVDWKESIKTVYIDYNKNQEKDKGDLVTREIGDFVIEGPIFNESNGTVTLFGKQGTGLMISSTLDNVEAHPVYKLILQISIDSKEQNTNYSEDLAQLKSILSEELSEATIKKITSYINSKTSKSVDLKQTFLYENDYQIILQSTLMNNHVDILVFKKR